MRRLIPAVFPVLWACQQPAPPRAPPEPVPACEKQPVREVKAERRCWEVGGVLCEPDLVDPYDYEGDAGTP